MEEDQQFCLRWNNHQSTLISVFDTLLENGTLVDCTLAAEGKFLKAHKVVLSACSPYFATLLSEQYDKHPIFILKDVKYQELRAMMDYMYRGEVNISQDQLAALLKAAESLQIKGLSDNRCGGGNQKPSSAEHKQLSVPGKLTGASGGYTLEQTKRARLGPSSVESQELSGSREGSSSPTSRRRKKVRRRSVDNVMADNHDNSNSSQSMQVNSSVPSANTQVGTITSVASIVPAAVSSLATSANLQAANITKKTDSLTKLGNTDAITTGADNEHADDNADKSAGTVSKKEQNHHKQRGATSSKIIVNESGKETEIVIEPKSEYDDGNDETVEDLTLDDEDMGLEDLDHTAGPSHGGEGSSQGYAQWQVDRSQDEVFMAAQEAQQRDPQDLSITRIAGLTWNEWNARLATMPLVTQLREGTNPLIFPTDLSINSQQNATTSSLTGSADRDRNKSPTIFPSPNGSNCISNAISSTPARLQVGANETINCNNNSINSSGNASGGGNNGGSDNDNENSQNAGSFSDSNNASGLCSLGLLNSLAMGSLMGGGGGGHPCPDCGRVYKLKSSLRNHQKWECGKEPQFKCPFCVYRAKQKMHIGRHMERMHKEKYLKLGEKVFGASADDVAHMSPAFWEGIKAEKK